MPPRWLTLAILGFWLLAMAWLTVREIAPRWRVGDPPPYTIDLTDEVSRQAIEWHVLQNKERVGRAKSSVQLAADHTFELQTAFRNLKISVFELRELTNTLHIDAAGKLIGFHVTAKGSAPIAGDIDVDISGHVQDGELQPEVRARAGGLQHVLRGKKAPTRGSVLNSLQVLNRISGLAEGQQWSGAKLKTMIVAIERVAWPAPQSLRTRLKPPPAPTIRRIVATGPRQSFANRSSCSRVKPRENPNV